MELALLVVLGLALIAVIGVLVYFGMKLSRAVEKNKPESDMAARVTPTGLALYGCMTAVLVLFLAAVTLEPDGRLGSFLRSAGGLVVALVGTVVFFSVAAKIFENIGYPILKRGPRGSTRRR